MAKAAKRSKGKTVTIHDQKIERREGGELHQIADGDTPVLTTTQGGRLPTI